MSKLPNGLLRDELINDFKVNEEEIEYLKEIGYIKETRNQNRLIINGGWIFWKLN